MQLLASRLIAWNIFFADHKITLEKFRYLFFTRNRKIILFLPVQWSRNKLATKIIKVVEANVFVHASDV